MSIFSFPNTARALALISTFSLIVPTEAFAAPVVGGAAVSRSLSGSSLVQPTAYRHRHHARRYRGGFRPEAAFAALALGAVGLAIANANRPHRRAPDYYCDAYNPCPVYAEPEYVEPVYAQPVYSEPYYTEDYAPPAVYYGGGYRDGGRWHAQPHHAGHNYGNGYVNNGRGAPQYHREQPHFGGFRPAYAQPQPQGRPAYAQPGPRFAHQPAPQYARQPTPHNAQQPRPAWRGDANAGWRHQ